MSGKRGPLVPLSSLAEVNPSTHTNGLGPSDYASFVPMSDVSEHGTWLRRQVRRIRDVSSGFTSFADGDVLFAKITPCMENGKGCHATNLMNGVGFGSTEFHVLRARSHAHGRFIFHWTQSPALRKRAEAFMTGSAGQQRVQTQFFDRFRVLSLSVLEQQRIAEILDTLDEAIRGTERVIAKLQQLNRGLLHDLLTRGIDDSGELRDPDRHPEQFKDSPLGRIPTEWVVMSIGATCDAVVDCPHSTPEYLDDGVLVARTMHVRDGQYDEDASSRVSERQFRERIARLEPKAGDVIFTREAPVGEAFCVPAGMRICLGQRVMLLRPSPRRLSGVYLVSQVYSGAVKKRISQLTGGTTNPHLNVGDVRDFLIPLPPYAEQERLASLMSAFDGRLAQERTTAVKVRALKRGLMHDLLTGRVRTLSGDSC